MPTASAQEVVDAAAKVGIALKANSVHAIRSIAKKRAGGGSRARRAGKSNGKVTASDFVRGMPGAPAKDVVTAAKKVGVKLSERYVYVIRSSDRAKARSGAASTRRWRGDGSEAALRQAIAELGLGRARQVLAEMESAFR